MNFYENLIRQAVMQIHTAYIAKVQSVSEKTAQVLPLTYSKSGNGTLVEPAPVTALVPPNVKFARKDITYLTSVSGNSEHITSENETATVFVPEELAPNDIVLCVVCERDISSALAGTVTEPSARHHNINDSVIIKVL